MDADVLLPTLAALRACWRVSVSSGSAPPSLGLGNRLISGVNDRVNTPRETGHFLSFSLTYIFFLENRNEKNPAVNSPVRRTQKWLCTSLPGGARVRKPEPWTSFSCTWPVLHHTGSFTYRFFFNYSFPEQGLVLSREAPPQPEPHHSSLHPSNGRRRSGHAPSRVSPSSSFSKSHHPRVAFLFPSP